MRRAAIGKPPKDTNDPLLRWLINALYEISNASHEENLTDIAEIKRDVGQIIVADGAKWVGTKTLPASGYDNPVNGFLYGRKDGGWEAAQPLTAMPLNRAVNPSMQISQENGDTGTTTVGGFGADQWQFTYAAATSMGAYRSQAIDMGDGVTTALVLNVPTADTSIAAGDHLAAYQYVEGLRVADFQWGTAYAKQAVLRFRSRHSVAGTYCVCLKNSGSTRSWIGEYTVSVAQVNVPVERTIVIPGDTTGTWLKDTGVGIQITFTAASGTTYHGVAGWQAGNKLSTAAQANGMGVIGTHIITDVGLYLDPENTGLPPTYERPDYDEALRLCQRYYEIVAESAAGAFAGVTLHSATLSTSGRTGPIPFTVTKRTPPAMSLVGAGTLVLITGGTVSSFTYTPISVRDFQITTVLTGATAGQCFLLRFDTNAGKIVANARL